MAYVTDAAREYAKKKIVKDDENDDKLLKELQNYFNELGKRDSLDEPTIYHVFKKDDRFHVKEEGTMYESDVTFKLDENVKLPLNDNTKIYDIRFYDIYFSEGELIDAADIFGAPGLSMTSIYQKNQDELRQILRNLYNDKYNALNEINKIIIEFEKKWNDANGRKIIKKYNLEGIDILDTLSPSLLYEYRDYNHRPSAAEIEDDIDEFIEIYSR